MFSKWRDRLRRTLGLRLAFWYAAVFTASTATLTIVTYVLLSASLEQRDHDIVTVTLHEYQGEYDTSGLDALAGAVDRAQRDGRHERLFVRVVTGDTTLFSSAPSEWGRFDIETLSFERKGDGIMWETARFEEKGSRLEVATVRLPDGARLQVGKSTESRDELLRRFRSLLGMIALAIVLLGLGGGIAVTRWTLRPAHRLAAAVRSIIETGRTDVRVHTESSGDPLDELGSLVNTMLDRITRLMEGMRDSLDNVAHDLRTPLARLRARAEAALTANDAAMRDDVLADAISEADRISATLDTLLDIAEARTGTLPLHLAPVNLGQLAEEVIDLYGDAANAKGLSLVAELTEDVSVPGDVARLRQVVANLVDNAIKYTGESGSVVLTVARKNEAGTMTVRDTGSGINPEDLPRIWDRLYRGDRSRSSRGLGLGLSVVKAFVEAHGGRVEVESAREGTVFTVHLPSAATSPAARNVNLSRL